MYILRGSGLQCVSLLRFCSSLSEDEISDDNFDAGAVAGPMFVHEVGGNIGECSLIQCCHIEWYNIIVSCHV